MEGCEALRRTAAWGDFSARGRIRATGEDRIRLLHGISSNDVEGLSPGEGVYAFFLNAQGRILADSHIFVAADHVLLDCEPGVGPSLLEHIESYVIMDDVSLEPVASETALLAVAGPQAGKAVAAVSARLPDKDLSFAATDGLIVYRVPLGDVPSYRIAVASDRKRAVIAALEAGGASAASENAWEAQRVQNGVPRFGVDFGPENIPHETQQLQAVSFTKGCYTGQEIVERVRSRGRVQRLLVGVALESSAIPADLTVRVGGKPVGALTSPTPGISPSAKACGFAIVRREAAVPGTAVEVGGTPARTVDVSRR